MREAKAPTDYAAYLFDVDGTLYAQRPLRLRMAVRMAAFALRHPGKLGDLRLVMQYRRLREQDDLRELSTEALADALADRRGLPHDRVRAAVQRWLFAEPLALLPRCAYRDVLEFLQTAAARGAVVAIYSDYPAADKLVALGVRADFVFCADDPQIAAQKPDRRAMAHILTTLGLPADGVLYVGDRAEKDGRAAALIGMPYCDVVEFRAALRAQKGTER